MNDVHCDAWKDDRGPRIICLRLHCRSRGDPDRRGEHGCHGLQNAGWTRDLWLLYRAPFGCGLARVHNVIPSFQGNIIPDLPYEAVDDKRGHYVNWPAKLDSLAEARTVAGIWAELAEQYRRAQERKALYIELIDRYVQTREKRMAGRRPEAEQRDCARNEVA